MQRGDNMIFMNYLTSVFADAELNSLERYQYGMVETLGYDLDLNSQRYVVDLCYAIYSCDEIPDLTDEQKHSALLEFLHYYVATMHINPQPSKKEAVLIGYGITSFRRNKQYPWLPPIFWQELASLDFSVPESISIATNFQTLLSGENVILMEDEKLEQKIKEYMASLQVVRRREHE